MGLLGPDKVLQAKGGHSARDWEEEMKAVDTHFSERTPISVSALGKYCRNQSRHSLKGPELHAAVGSCVLLLGTEKSKQAFLIRPLTIYSLSK